MSTTQSPDPNDRERGVSGAATETIEATPQRPDRPSMRQMTVSALTAVSATALLSLVGVWGTVFGMGLLSILTVLGNYMYSSFFQRTAERVKQGRPVAPYPRGNYSAATETRPLDDATRIDLEPITAEQLNSADNGTIESTHAGDEDDERPAGRLRTAWRAMIERYGRRRIVLSIVAVFVVLAGAVTVVEMVAGKPMSGIVRNESGSGTSVFGGNTSAGSGADDSDGSDGGSSDPDEESDQQDPPDGDLHDEEPPADEQTEDERPPADEPQQDGDPQDEQPEDEEPPADEPDDEQPPAEEPQQEEPQPEEPPADEPQQDAPPAE